MRAFRDAMSEVTNIAEREPKKNILLLYIHSQILHAAATHTFIYILSFAIDARRGKTSREFNSIYFFATDRVINLNVCFHN